MHLKSLDADNEDIPFSGAFSIEFRLSKQTITCTDYKYDEDVLALWNKVNPSFALKSMFGGYDELMEPCVTHLLLRSHLINLVVIHILTK